MASTSPVLIIGAGPAGLSMACALADIGIACTVLEQAPLASIAEPAEDGREIALTHRGMAQLQRLGAWQDLPPAQISPLRAARVFNGSDTGFLSFAAEGSQDRLGSLVPNHWLRRIAYQGALRRAEHITLRGESRVQAIELGAQQASVRLAGGEVLQAQLLIAADSRFSSSRRAAGIGAEMRDFGRSVIVCRMAHQLSHDGAALECFHHGHTMAWLPLNDEAETAAQTGLPHLSSLVLTLPSDHAQAMLGWDGDRFTAWVQQHSQDRLGRLALCGPRHHYPLVATYAHRFVAQRFALIGDAAVGMHPVTAHGYNFGLYGVQTLAELLQTQPGDDCGNAALLARFERIHRQATWAIYQGTNTVVRLFTDESPPARLLRRGVLQAAQHLPPLKAAITAQLTGRQPPWLRQLQQLGASWR
ncbi:5-demethoxyubiquinol-8 5-hydroxylase UbiM [Paucibacter sp. APW11]|uniref:5-demethoxyubiquinol-8 5-hydroxylase UbiM n=1 Tax=Roseateles aquae TaxID=3077235 RepID=A0ABU3PA52_9BURK|nr:5-demethoxyubiquinol-8 5-hydroxylase UbiM [Paucibacter sp. APW11]MDT8999105.1 5-demethoxyubiquinol-8 5-hydroxylase UbiM [Paucibacter sp. APW11]